MGAEGQIAGCRDSSSTATSSDGLGETKSVAFAVSESAWVGSGRGQRLDGSCSAFGSDMMIQYCSVRAKDVGHRSLNAKSPTHESASSDQSAGC